MSGTNTGIPNFYTEQFSANIALKLQQKGSRLRKAVMTGSHTGKQASPVNQVGAVAANKVTGRFNPMGRVDAPTDLRWVLPQDYDLPQLIDMFDKLRLITDPTSAYVENAVYAMGRAQDQEILDGLLGANKTGDQGATLVSLPSSQIVGVAQGAVSATNMSVAKMRAAKKLLMAAEVDLENDELYMAINAAGHDSLLAETQVISLDYNDKPVLVEGKITRFLGINLIHTEMVPTGTDDMSGTSTKCPVWAKSGMYLGMWNDISTSISQRNDLQGLPWQAYAYGTFGGTRLEEKKVVQIWAR